MPWIFLKRLNRLVIYDSILRYGSSKNHSLQRLASGESHVCLSVGKAMLHIYNSMLEGESLRLMYGYCPSRFQRVLGKGADNGLVYLFRLLVKLIFHVLPLLWSNIYNLRLTRRAHLYVVVINIDNLAYHAVIILLICR